MRVLIAGTTYAPALNGQAVFMTNLAERLAAQGHSVAVLAPSETGPAEESVVNGVQIVRPRTKRLTYWHPNAVLPLFPGGVVDDLFDRFQPHVVHIHDHYPLSWRVVQAARRRSLPVIGSNHFMPENLAPYLPLWRAGQPLYRIILWHWMLRLYNTLDCVTVQSHAARSILERQGLQRPMHLISCGIDLEKFHRDPDLNRQAVRRRFGLNPTRTLFLFVGRVDYEKSLDVLIGALARAECTDCHLAIAGWGAELADLENLAESVGVAERVHFLGCVSDADKRDLLNSADVFAMPSAAELLSIATLEAMACGRPVLAARARALPELVADGKNGRLFRPGDVDDAASALFDLANHPQAWAAMGAASRRLAEAHAWPSVLTRYEQAYAQCIQRKPVRIDISERALSGKKRTTG